MQHSGRLLNNNINDIPGNSTRALIAYMYLYRRLVTTKINLIDNGWEDEDTGLEIGEKKPLDIALAM